MQLSCTKHFRFALILLFSTLMTSLSVQSATRPATEDALDAMESSFVIEVTETPGFIRFDNRFSNKTVGLLIEPGGEVDPVAYARIARKIAGAGYPVVIDKTPSELVIAGVMPSMVGVVKQSNPDITAWALAGHSLGGVIAGRYIAQNPADISVKGLALWASFPDPNMPISYRTDLIVASIYGEMDCLVPKEDVLGLAWTLPFTATIVQMDGANHAQWGDYGPQEGDCEAEITPTQQKIRGKRSTIELVLSQIESSQ
ncbi:Alpha/beta hydrolase family protein [Microbulbifer aggregans]|uniref:Alpha/beta hydrolase family protein n=1 Tax=Microbulbifer aggregans TaxID=1769779 RepID=A0A1C9W5W8_9GAMM|nr:alpha/beta hydrolase [Microbulbifer aggregans]AOS96542.1 Alpha/beta hydrolase family protein [Microbulbifer aggregans]